MLLCCVLFHLRVHMGGRERPPPVPHGLWRTFRKGRCLHITSIRRARAGRERGVVSIYTYDTGVTGRFGVLPFPRGDSWYHGAGGR
jgi:hypothetical protein